MSIKISTPWHKESFNRFMEDRLPQLLSSRIPLAGYHFESTGSYTCSVRIILATDSVDIEVDYTDIPQPDDEGLFKIDGKLYVAMPFASDEYLDTAQITCVGEQLYEYFEEKLGEPSDDLPWDESLLRTSLPLDTWAHEWLEETVIQRQKTGLKGARWSLQFLDRSNWLSKHTHLRRIVIPSRKKVFTPGQLGRTCPFEVPEGPNIGHILTVALGAQIRDGKLEVVDEKPEATLGLSASFIPFLEHNDPARSLMGANMMRQWLFPSQPEPALVQTGNEPDLAEFWCGHNLLTAFISWDANTFEEGIVISRSCAQRLNFFKPWWRPSKGEIHKIEPGDKLSNRHGAKGVVSRILPDEEMPHLADGTPVELIYSLCGLPSRMNFGQIREAVMGRIAKAEGNPAIVAPFESPVETELRKRLEKAGLPEDGMETLVYEGKKLRQKSTVGWVYWGCTAHIAVNKIQVSVDKSTHSQKQAEAEYFALRETKAFENILEHFNTRSINSEGSEGFASRLAEGHVEQAGPPSPIFAELLRRLEIAGIRGEFERENLTFRFADLNGAGLKLARPIPHPWLPQHKLERIDDFEELTEYGALVEANDRMKRMIGSRSPDSLAESALANLEKRVKEFFDALLTPENLQFNERVLFSGRAVIIPGDDLNIDQVGLPDEIAWTLFGPQVVRELGDEEEVEKRSKKAAKVLDEVMSQSWVILYRSPSITPLRFIAFHPVRCPDRAIRIHPFVCAMLDADFDGDQVAVFLPVTEAAQREAEESLSVAGHLARDPESIISPYLGGHEALLGLESGFSLMVRLDGLLGLVRLALTPEGLRKINEFVGVDVELEDGVITNKAINNALRQVLKRDGSEKFFDTIEGLYRLGFESAKGSGASINPFFGSNLDLPSKPEDDDSDSWIAYGDEIIGRLVAHRDYLDNDIGPLCLSTKSGAKGQWSQIASIVGSRGTVTDVNERTVTIRHGFREGLTPEELYALAFNSREQIAKIAFEWIQSGEKGQVAKRAKIKGYNVLTRAMRSKNPGVVFARAAASNEVDPLEDLDSRLFVGLLPKS